MYTDYFGSLKTPLISVFGVRKDFLDVNTLKTSISASAAKELFSQITCQKDKINHKMPCHTSMHVAPTIKSAKRERKVKVLIL